MCVSVTRFCMPLLFVRVFVCVLSVCLYIVCVFVHVPLHIVLLRVRACVCSSTGAARQSVRPRQSAASIPSPGSARPSRAVAAKSLVAVQQRFPDGVPPLRGGHANHR